MNVAKVLSKLTAGAKPLAVRMDGSHVVEISGQDVAAAMAGLSLLQSALLRVKWMDDLTSLPDLLRYWKSYACYHAALKGWRVGSYYVEQMAEQILEERIYGKCKRCKGRDHIYRRGSPDPVECDKCGGTGAIRPNGSQRARKLGISQPAYKQNWEAKFEVMDQMLDEVEQDGLRTVGVRLRENLLHKADK